MRDIQRTLLIPLSTLGIVGPIVFVGAFLIAGASRPGYSAVSQAISALGTGKDGWQEDVPAFILGLCLLGFTIAFCWSMVGVLGSASIAWSTSAFTVLSVVWITVSIFTSAPSTRAVHTAASLVGEIAVIVGIGVVGFGLRKNVRWRMEARTSLAVASLSLVILILTFTTSQPRLSQSVQLGGLFERILVILVLGWCAFFAARQIQHARHRALS